MTEGLEAGIEIEGERGLVAGIKEDLGQETGSVWGKTLISTGLLINWTFSAKSGFFKNFGLEFSGPFAGPLLLPQLVWWGTEVICLEQELSNSIFFPLSTVIFSSEVKANVICHQGGSSLILSQESWPLSSEQLLELTGEGNRAEPSPYSVWNYFKELF